MVYVTRHFVVQQLKFLVNRVAHDYQKDVYKVPVNCAKEACYENINAIKIIVRNHFEKIWYNALTKCR